MSYDDDNIFAKILRGELPCEKVYEDDATFALMDIMPRVDGHVLVIPKSPARNMLDAGTEQLSQCLATAQLIARAQIEGLGADGITVQQFNETAGGQEVFHLHYHVLPRHEGDRLRPPGTKEKPEVLKAHADKIRSALNR